MSFTSSTDSATACPLCDSDNTREIHRDRARPYLRCAVCGLIFVPPEFHVPPEYAASRYALHRNSPSDNGYRSHLSPLVDLIADRLPPGSSGLDFGCGPGPTLSVMFRERGYPVEDYDPLFANNRSLLNRRYDFVVCSEVVEHLSYPRATLSTLVEILNPGGALGVMTQMTDGITDYSRWHYMKDETHISFFSSTTFHYLATRVGMSLEVFLPSLALLLLPSHEPRNNQH